MTTVKKTGSPSSARCRGSHCCHFFQTRQDLLEPLLPYFKAGLESRELCVWIIHKPLTEAAARRAHIQRGNWSLYVPLATCLLLSVILTLVFSLFGRR